MGKNKPIRIIEIEVHRSKRNSKLGHAVALLLPCNHHKYLGITLYKGEGNRYRTQSCTIIKFDYYDVMDKEVCKLCPQDDLWINDLILSPETNDIVNILEAMEDEI